MIPGLARGSRLPPSRVLSDSPWAVGSLGVGAVAVAGHGLQVWYRATLAFGVRSGLLDSPPSPLRFLCATLKMPPIGVRVRTRPSGAVKYEVLRDFASCLLSHAVRSLWGCTSPPTECAGPYHSQKRSRERLWRGSRARQLPLLTRGYYRYILIRGAIDCQLKQNIAVWEGRGSERISIGATRLNFG